MIYGIIVIMVCFHDVLCGGGMPRAETCNRASLRDTDTGHIFRYRTDGRKGSGHSIYVKSLAELAYLNPKDSNGYRNNAVGIYSTPSGSHVPI